MISRYEGDSQSIPIVNISAGGGAIKMLDCRFSSLPLDYLKPQDSALSISDCSSTTLVHCNFFTPAGQGIRAGDATGRLHLQECLFHGDTAIRLSSKAAQRSRLQIEIERSISIGRCLLDNDPQCRPVATDLAVTDSILQNYTATISLSDAPDRRLAKSKQPRPRAQRSRQLHRHPLR